MSLLTITQVSERLACSESHVYSLVGSKLRCHRIGKGNGGIRVSEEQLAVFLRETEQGGHDALRSASREAQAPEGLTFPAASRM